MKSIEGTTIHGIPCVKMSACGYTAWIAHGLGSNVLRLRNDDKNVEIFRYEDGMTSEEIRNSAEVWGLPTLYLPNRFADGILKTSDAIYNLPVNEKAPYNNHIHGFIHKRTHAFKSAVCDENGAKLVTEYIFDENDEFFKYLPIKFKADYTFELNDDGFKQTVSFTNLSDKMMPISLATHTTINTPFVDGGKEENIRLTVPCVEKCELNERCLPTEKMLDLTAYDMEYKNGTKTPVLQDISNDMYTICEDTLDDKPFYGVSAVDTESGIRLCYEVSKEYGFFIIWNDRGFNGYFCPEPMTAMIDAPNLSLDKSVTGYREIAKDETFTAWQHFYLK